MSNFHVCYCWSINTWCSIRDDNPRVLIQYWLQEISLDMWSLKRCTAWSHKLYECICISTHQKKKVISNCLSSDWFISCAYADPHGPTHPPTSPPQSSEDLKQTSKQKTPPHKQTVLSQSLWSVWVRDEEGASLPPQSWALGFVYL